MSSLNINTLYATMYGRNIKRYQKFDDILKRLHNRIKYHAINEKTYCFFQIPEFIIGVPLYNINDLKEYLIKSLQKDGFEYMYIEPNLSILYTCASDVTCNVILQDLCLSFYPSLSLSLSLCMYI